MLYSKLANCPECANIPSLLKKIDCKLAELGNNLFNNITFILNKPINPVDIIRLINYRRILLHKYNNPCYLNEFNLNIIANKVIKLTAGCTSRCNTPEPCYEEPCNLEVVINPTTTTSTTILITTTTSSTTTII
jgi:hypothetical protein